MEDKLKRIISVCKCSVSLTVNPHKDLYEDVIMYFNRHKPSEVLDDIEYDIWEEMIKKDRIIELQFYPKTPIGFYTLYHYDLDLVLTEALRVLKEECGVEI